MSDEYEAADAVGPDRRTFVKGLIAAGIFATPVVSSFTMSGVESVFGAVPLKLSTGLVSNCNLTQGMPAAPPGFPTLLDQFVFYFTGQHFVMVDGATQVALDVPGVGSPGAPTPALPTCTIISVFKGDLAVLASMVPTGQTPLNGYAVVWRTQGKDPEEDAVTPLVLTVTNAPVVAGNTVYRFDKVSGDPVEETVAADGTWTVSFVEDPGFVVTQPTSGSGEAPAANGPTPVTADPNTVG